MAERDPVIEALVKNTAALINMNATLSTFQQDYVQGKQSAREHANNVDAKLDNYDRSLSELRLASENGEMSRRDELKRIFDLLNDERSDRKAITATAGKDERELLREIVREEMGERKKERSLAVDAGRAVWAVGGKYIVAALAVLFVAAVMKLTGMNLADIIGLAGK